MRNRHLKELLSELPRYEAGEGYTEELIKRIAKTDRPEAEGTRWGLALLSAAASIAIAAGATHFALQQRDQARVDMLETQRKQLQAEIAEIRNEAEYDAVIDMGQEDGVQYILDLRPVEIQPQQTVALEPVFY